MWVFSCLQVLTPVIRRHLEGAAGGRSGCERGGELGVFVQQTARSGGEAVSGERTSGRIVTWEARVTSKDASGLVNCVF